MFQIDARSSIYNINCVFIFFNLVKVEWESLFADEGMSDALEVFKRELGKVQDVVRGKPTGIRNLG